MDYKKMTDEELKNIKKDNFKIIIIGLIAVVIAFFCLSMINTNTTLACVGSIIGICVCFFCTIYASIKNRPIEMELASRGRKAYYSKIHNVIPSDCNTIINVISSNTGMKRGQYYIWKDNNYIKLYPINNVLDNSSDLLTSLLINDILSYEKIGERYHETKISGGGKNKVSVTGAVIGNAIGGTAGAVLLGNKGSKPIKSKDIVHDDRRLRINLSYRQEIICSLQDYNTIKLLLPDKDIDNLSNNVQIQNTVQISSADEIMKYKKLLDDGIITLEEFEQKKQQLLQL